MDFFSLHKSKKTSETGMSVHLHQAPNLGTLTFNCTAINLSRVCLFAGQWVDDAEVENCYCCGVKFSFVIRKHHCRVRSLRLSQIYPTALRRTFVTCFNIAA
jgi:hypothetical protein